MANTRLPNCPRPRRSRGKNELRHDRCCKLAPWRKSCEFRYVEYTGLLQSPIRTVAGAATACQHALRSRSHWHTRKHATPSTRPLMPRLSRSSWRKRVRRARNCRASACTAPLQIASSICAGRIWAGALGRVNARGSPSYGCVWPSRISTFWMSPPTTWISRGRRNSRRNWKPQKSPVFL